MRTEVTCPRCASNLVLDCQAEDSLARLRKTVQHVLRYGKLGKQSRARLKMALGPEGQK